MRIEAISAVTLRTRDMSAAIAFYEALGFELSHGGREARFTSFRVGQGHLNLTLQTSAREWPWWGRVIFYVSDVDEMHSRALEAGLRPHAEPRDAEWGERYFHITDADGHELSFARPLA
jgi:catechol 2,3-dioxygenase-like lactoylglutathione lyase family enzyme